MFHVAKLKYLKRKYAGKYFKIQSFFQNEYINPGAGEDFR